MPSLNVSLTPELIEVIKDKVSGGMYNNASEVIREAVRRFDEYDSLLYGIKQNRLRDTLSPGLEQAKNGQFVEKSIIEICDEADREELDNGR